MQLQYDTIQTYINDALMCKLFTAVKMELILLNLYTCGSFNL